MSRRVNYADRMTRGPRRATVKDVAALAGVSPKTVSNVMNGTVFVRPDTQEKVLAAVEELGFVPNLSARSLRNGRTGVIALALPDLAPAFGAADVSVSSRGLFRTSDCGYEGS